MHARVVGWMHAAVFWILDLSNLQIHHYYINTNEITGELSRDFKHGHLEIRNFSSRVEKYFARSLRSLVKYFSTLEEKFRICARPCNILYLFYLIILTYFE